MRIKDKMNRAIAGVGSGLLILALFLVSCKEERVLPVNITPKPISVVKKAGVFTITSDSKIEYQLDDTRMGEIADYTQSLISKYSSLNLTEESESSSVISLKISPLEDKNPEAYRLSVDGSGVEILANSHTGIFYGVQTLRQLIEPNSSAKSVDIPYVTILDAPSFKWRGLHLDVGRHFFSKDDVIRFIDLMSLYKINKFHWHLTEDQGWRIEIKAFAKLTEVGAWRERVGFEGNQKLGLNKDDGSEYGGFYTQEEVKEVVEYARLRGVDVVPEIEMPGHSVAALVSYPHLACFPDEKREVRLTGGVSDGVYCAGKESTFTFIEQVLDEVLELFPSEYIHIGGDEAPKRNWQRCEACQKRIKDEGLHNEHELQSYFIQRAERYLNSHGRKLVGWDEILEGGVSKSATIMSWRGITPGIEAAEAGNEVIMTPGTPMYISRPQSINSVTKGSGSVQTMRDLYEFIPIPEELSSEAAKNIIGVQACHWTEGTPTMEILEYKEYPRAIALAEMGWTSQENRDWNDFYRRWNQDKKHLDLYGVKYGQRSYDVRINLIPGVGNRGIFAQFISEIPDTIYYTIDGSEPTKSSPIFTENIEIKKSGTIQARMYRADGSAGRIVKEDVFFHKAIGKSVNYKINYSSKHNGGGKYGLTNGLLKKWQGFEKRDVNLTLDLGAVTKITKIKTSWWYDTQDWVHKPKEVTYEVSKDGENFKNIFTFSHSQEVGLYNKGVLPLEKVIEPTEVRYIRVKAKSIMENPEWHGSAGAAAWIFIDEIVVE